MYQILYEYYETLPKEDLERYDCKLRLLGRNYMDFSLMNLPFQLLLLSQMRLIALLQNYLPYYGAYSKSKMFSLGLGQCPYKFPADSWTEDPTEWPPMSYHHLYHYLIKSPRKLNYYLFSV